MFRGEASYNIDAKGRVIMPARFRYNLGERFIITKGLDKCLFVFTMEKWAEYEKKIEAMPMTEPVVRKFMRLFVGGAVDVEVDAQGRVIIPPSLREYAGIDKDIIIVGVGGRIEIWSNELWKAYNESGDYYDDVAAKMAEFSI
jgi:MraZ protein